MDYAAFWQFFVGNVEQFNTHPKDIILFAFRHIVDDAWQTRAILEHGNTLFRHIFTIEFPAITELLKNSRYTRIHLPQPCTGNVV
ncbi:hypothetical protein [Methylorubrum sp. POS3]|uniref:hypothetical protein n=1 Tax=Methylorubrum sp. POS3 TaxID=2998492 RepID=UPI0037279D37